MMVLAQQPSRVRQPDVRFHFCAVSVSVSGIITGPPRRESLWSSESFCWCPSLGGPPFGRQKTEPRHSVGRGRLWLPGPLPPA